MERDALLAELRALHPGRGLRRPGLAMALGSTLAELAGVTSATSDEDARAAVVDLLGRYLDRFPRDLKVLFRAAAAISDDDPFLENRLLALEPVLKRGPRSLRRRLRQAEQLLADAILQEHGARDGGGASRGWQWITQDFDLTLGADAVVEQRRTLLALDDHQKFVKESFFLVDWSPDDHLEVEVLDGAELVSLTTDRPGLWELTLQLPCELRRGREVDIRLRVGISRARALSPFLMMLLIRSTRRVSFAVHFAAPSGARRAWVVAGVPAPAAHVPAVDQRFIDVAAGADVTASFDHPEIGLAYGIAWEWAD